MVELTGLGLVIDLSHQNNELDYNEEEFNRAEYEDFDFFNV